eukprot:16242209-Heterocapsa_arctica.AAC.1
MEETSENKVHRAGKDRPHQVEGVLSPQEVAAESSACAKRPVDLGRDCTRLMQILEDEKKCPDQIRAWPNTPQREKY